MITYPQEVWGRDITTQERHHEVTPELLARKWGCGLLTVRQTLKHTTQLGVRSAIDPLTRRYRTDILQLHYRRLVARFFTETMFSKKKSLMGNTCAQIYTDGGGFITVYPMKSKGQVGQTLKNLVQDVGIPNALTFDGSLEQVGPETHFQKTMRKYQITGRRNEAETQKYQRAEDGIREIKCRWKWRIFKSRVPKRVWDYAIVWESEILSQMCRH